MLNPLVPGLRVEPTRKELWLHAFIAALHRVSPADALVAADEALRLCDERWKKQPVVGSVNYAHDYPVGHVFANWAPPEVR